jgi:hypothetical protein
MNGGAAISAAFRTDPPWHHLTLLSGAVKSVWDHDWRTGCDIYTEEQTDLHIS